MLAKFAATLLIYAAAEYIALKLLSARLPNLLLQVVDYWVLITDISIIIGCPFRS